MTSARRGPLTDAAIIRYLRLNARRSRRVADHLPPSARGTAAWLRREAQALEVAAEAVKLLRKLEPGWRLQSRGE